MTAEEFEARIEKLIAEAQVSLPDEVLALKLQDAADALREGMSC
jgi:hypothetical protein